MSENDEINDKKIFHVRFEKGVEVEQRVYDEADDNFENYEILVKFVNVDYFLVPINN